MADRLLLRGSDLCDEFLGRVIQLPETLLDRVSRAIGFASSCPAVHTPPFPAVMQPATSGLTFPAVVSTSPSPSSIPFPIAFESQFGPLHPLFHASPFACALDLGRAERRPVFVYLHAPQVPETAAFCSETLCSEVVTEFLNANFVCWGASLDDDDKVDGGEGVQLAGALGASQFPFCAILAPGSGDEENVVVLQQVQGVVSPSGLVDALQIALEEASAFMDLACEEEDVERETLKLWETLDAQYRETVQLDNKMNGFREIAIEGEEDSTEQYTSAEDRLRKDSTSREDTDALAVEITSSARQWNSVPVAAEQQPNGTTPRRPASAGGRLAKMEKPTEEKVQASEIVRAPSFSGSRRRPRSVPPSGRNGARDPAADQPITQILIRFPNGQAREHSFLKTDKIRDVYKFVDSVPTPPARTEGGYRLISSFPRKVYGPEQLDTSLVDAGLHPKATLLLEFIN